MNGSKNKKSLLEGESDSDKINTQSFQILQQNTLEVLEDLTDLIIKKIKVLKFSQENRELPNQNRKISLERVVRDFEIALIKNALFQADNNQLKAAELLGLKPTTLGEKIKRYRKRLNSCIEPNC